MSRQNRGPVVERRVWTFTSTSRGLRQIIYPALHAVDGRCTEPPREANFGGDDGKQGRWQTEELPLVEALRNKMRQKTLADQCIVETTKDKSKGDLVKEAR